MDLQWLTNSQHRSVRHRSSPYFLSVSRPTIRNIPKSLYAKQYRVGAHATTGHEPAVLNVCTCSPVSTWETSRPLPIENLWVRDERQASHGCS
ncbi:hypothetical protein E4U54_007074 [Claviceps lovelessii]|nr:hypothetical protein E4U54_007074 [Claviceps lovelessii]